MKFCKFIKEHILILLLIITLPENLSAMTWGNYLYNLIPSRQTTMQRTSQLLSSLSNLMRPQLDPQLISQLPAQWSNLTPAQQNIIQYMALFGLGGAGMAYWLQRQKFKEEQKEQTCRHLQSEKDVNAIIAKIPESLRGILKKLQDSEKMSGADLKSLEDQLYDTLTDLNEIKNEIVEDDYNTTIRDIHMLLEQIQSKKSLSMDQLV